MLVKDTHPNKVPSGNWRGARNIIKDDSAFSPERGFEAFSEVFEDDFCGAIKLNEEFIVFTVGTTSSIYHVDKNGNNTCIIADDALNFHLENPIWGVFQTNFKGDTIIAFWDGVADNSNPPRILNINDLPFELNPDCSLVNPDEISLLNMFSNVKPPSVTLNSVNNSGGSLKTGTYSVFTFYELNDGTRTNYQIVGNVINIYERDIENNNVPADDLYVFEGSDGGVDTNKSVNITVTELDNKFDKIGVGLIGYNNGVITQFVEGIYNIGGATVDVLLTGNQSTVGEVTLDELIVPPIIYTGARTGTVLNKRLYLSNLKIDDPQSESIQAFVNDIQVRYTYDPNNVIGINYEDSLLGYKNPKVVYDKRTFLPDEVYAFYAGVVTSNGEQIFHIPGRSHRAAFNLFHFSDEGSNSIDPPNASVVASEKDLVSAVIPGLAGFDTTNLDNAVAINSNIKVFHIFDTASATFDDAISGLPGYWENENEQYPDDYPDFAGENVRHHRMPSIEHLKSYYGFETIGDNKAEIALGVRFQNINIPPELADDIIAIKFYYAAKGSSNSLVVCNSIVLSHDESSLQYTDLSGKLRMQDMNLLLSKETLGAAYFKAHYYQRTTSEGILRPEVTLYSTVNDSAVNMFRPLRKVNKAVYLPANVNSPDANNIDREETIYVEFDDDIIFESYPGSGTDFDIMYGSLFRFQTNVHIGYESQDLVFTGATLYTGTEIDAFGGDAFVTPYSNRHIYLTGDINNLAQVVIASIYNRVNHWLRQSDGLNIFHPFDDGAILAPNNDNYFEYNYDYTAVNNFFPYRELIDSGVPGETLNRVTKFPYRTARSTAQSDESTIIGWRIFLTNDYYENVRRAGEIVATRALSKTLIVHHEFALFVFVARERLSANDIEVNLGAGDIFQAPPDEIVPEDSGYFGTRHQASCIVCKAGYVAVDDVQGKIGIFDGQFKEISNVQIGKSGALRDFFRRYAKCLSDIDNSYTGDGWLTGFDEDENRLLFTKYFGLSDPRVTNTVINYSVFTISYSLDDGWIGFHDYDPNIYLFNRSGLFSLRNFGDRRMWKHNADNIATYYDGEIKESYIDYIISADEFFKVTNVNWQSISVDEVTGVHNEFETISKLVIYNDKQCTGEIELKYASKMSIGLAARNVDQHRNVWHFNQIRDVVKDRSQFVIDDKDNLNTSNFDSAKGFNKKLKFIGNYVIIRLIWDNQSQNNIEIYNINVQPRRINR